jgi:hypothetical protein
MGAELTLPLNVGSRKRNAITIKRSRKTAGRYFRIIVTPDVCWHMPAPQIALPVIVTDLD